MPQLAARLPLASEIIFERATKNLTVEGLAQPRLASRTSFSRPCHVIVNGVVDCDSCGKKQVMEDGVLDSWQYRLARHARPGARPVGDLWLEVGPGMPVIPVTDAVGTFVGLLLGFPIDLAGRFVITANWQTSFQLTGDIDAFAQKVLLALGGRFLWISAGSGVARVYPDSSAQVSCIFDPLAKMAGSTAGAILDDTDYDARFDKFLFNRLEIDGEGWFPAGLTAHHGIHRLLPNHYLDLETWKACRFWPTADLATANDPMETVDEIIAIVQAQIEALLAGPKKLAFALTAGHETRLLLACARPYLKDIDFVTVTGGDRHEVDTVVARRIAKDLGLRHITLPRKKATDEQRALFIRRGGHCNADTNSHFHPSVWPIAQSHYFAGGVGGEVARAFFWRTADSNDKSLTSAKMVSRFGLSAAAELTSAVDRWLSELPPVDIGCKLDLAYLEHRDGAWYAAQFCCDPTLVRLAPLLTFRTVELMIGLPAEWKQNSQLGHAVIARLWPELARYPFNSLGRWKDLLVKTTRLMKNPRLLIKKLRKMRH
jgi:hypothetical protein